MSDIEKLIERLFADLVIDKPGYDALMRAADAQARLVAPLPAEVAEEARYLRMLANATVPDLPHVTLPDSLRDIADMLESLALENARLAAENAELRRNEEHHVLHTLACPMRSIPGAECLCGDVVAIEVERDRLRAELDAVDQALLEEENYYANVGGDPAALRSARDTLGALARVRAKLDTKKGGV